MSAATVFPLLATREIGAVPLDADFASLERRWITRELAIAAGIRRVDSYTGASFVGRRDNGSYAGLLIPYTLPGESRVREWRLRRDHPDIEYGKDGRPKERGKYLSPPGRANMMYFAPDTPTSLLMAKDVPVVLTEGEFKTLALWRLATHDIGKPRFLPAGLSGVWNWRGTVGKTTGPNGDRRDVKGTIPDLDRFSWDGRRVIIAFDADAEKNDSVQAAKTQLARELRIRGAEVACITWDIAQGKGIDDLLATVGPAKALEIIESADFDAAAEADDDISVWHLAEAITAKHRFARDRGGKLYVYRDGCYRPDGASIVHRQVKIIMERLRQSPRWSSHKSEEVVKYIAVDAPVLWERPPRDVVNVLNGLLDVSARNLAPHSPDFMSPVQLPVKFDPEARCPRWDDFIATTFPEDAEPIAWEIPAWLMTPDTSIQKAILLTGDGANGKSTYLAAVLAFIGKHNAAAVSLHKLENDRFSVARLVGKLANVCPDLPSTDLTSTSVFKAITGGDELLAERKFEASFEFTPYARLVFSANHPPKSQDASSAFFRRWVVIPFERTFTEGAKGTMPRGQLDAMLADPVELSGVLNKALLALESLRSNGFTECDSTRRAMDEFRQATDPMAVWLDTATVLLPHAFVVQDRLWQEYNKVCDAAGRPALSKTAFGRALKKLRPTVTDARRTVSADRPWVYVGIGLRAEVER
jgi:P4 family phage/plasmid primase-like protien